MQRYRNLLLGVLVSGGLVVGGCQLLSGVDTIEYSTGGAGGASSRSSSDKSSSNGKSSSTEISGSVDVVSGTGSLMPDVAASSTGTAMGRCGDGVCEPGESQCSCPIECFTAKPDNGCCEPTEDPLEADCAYPVMCNHNGTCDPQDSCDHCSDCSECFGKDCPPTKCYQDCNTTADCPTDQMGPPPACCDCPLTPQTVCVVYGMNCLFYASGSPSSTGTGWGCAIISQ